MFVSHLSAFEGLGLTAPSLAEDIHSPTIARLQHRRVANIFAIIYVSYFTIHSVGLTKFLIFWLVVYLLQTVGGRVSPNVTQLQQQQHQFKMASSSGTKLAQEIHDEFLVCKICLESYKNPKSLACLHTFCEDCIENHIASESTYKKYIGRAISFIVHAWHTAHESHAHCTKSTNSL